MVAPLPGWVGADKLFVRHRLTPSWLSAEIRVVRARWSRRTKHGSSAMPHPLARASATRIIPPTPSLRKAQGARHWGTIMLPLLKLTDDRKEQSLSALLPLPPMS